MTLIGFLQCLSLGGFCRADGRLDRPGARVSAPRAGGSGSPTAPGRVGGLAASLALPRLLRLVTPARIALAALPVAAALGVLVSRLPDVVGRRGADVRGAAATTLVMINSITYRQQVTPEHLLGRVNTAGRMLSWGWAGPEGRSSRGCSSGCSGCGRPCGPSPASTWSASSSRGPRRCGGPRRATHLERDSRPRERALGSQRAHDPPRRPPARGLGPRRLPGAGGPGPGGQRLRRLPRPAPPSLDPRWLGGEMWGCFEDGRLVSACHVGANLVPVQATADGARRLRRAGARPAGRRVLDDRRPAGRGRGASGRRSRDALGPAARGALAPAAPGDRAAAPAVAPDPLVRRTTQDEVDALYPACVAMYTEEVGISPESAAAATSTAPGSQQLIAPGWSFARIEDGRVVFKAEVALRLAARLPDPGRVRRPGPARARGWPRPAWRPWCETALREIAPVVSLYVNEPTAGPRGPTRRAGFERDRHASPRSCSERRSRMTRVGCGVERRAGIGPAPLHRDVKVLAGIFATSRRRPPGPARDLRADRCRRSVPAHREVILASGVAELACAAGLLHPRTRRLAGWASAALLLAVFPGNVKMAARRARRPTTRRSRRVALGPAAAAAAADPGGAQGGPQGLSADPSPGAPAKPRRSRRGPTASLRP